MTRPLRSLRIIQPIDRFVRPHIHRVLLYTGGRTITVPLRYVCVPTSAGLMIPTKVSTGTRFPWHTPLIRDRASFSINLAGRNFVADVHSREARFDDRCPSCLQPDESDDNLVQCLHEDRRHSECDPNNSSFVAMFLCSPTTYTNPYIFLRRSQDFIGWDHFLSGKNALILASSSVQICCSTTFDCTIEELATVIDQISYIC